MLIVIGFADTLRYTLLRIFQENTYLASFLISMSIRIKVSVVSKGSILKPRNFVLEKVP